VTSRVNRTDQDARAKGALAKRYAVPTALTGALVLAYLGLAPFCACDDHAAPAAIRDTELDATRRAEFREYRSGQCPSFAFTQPDE
jgi:hypothetical protein